MDDSRFNVDQRKALYAKGNVLVSASAGSGKTTVVIEKILRIIAGGGDIRRMAVMTFSRAAAAEMKNRLLKGLYDLMRSGGGNSHVATQLTAFPFANICTIDSFCLNLVRKYFAIVGADPTAKPADPDEAALMWAECVDEACEEKLRDGDEAFLGLAERYTSSRKLDNVKELISSLRTFLKVQTDPDAFLETDFRDKQENYLLCEMRRRIKLAIPLVQESLPALKEVGMEEEFESALRMRELLERVENGSLGDVFAVLKNAPKIQKTRKRKAVYQTAKELFHAGVDSYRDLLELVDDFTDLYYDRDDRMTLSDSRALVDVTLRAEKLYTERKRREGKIDFNDMGALALAILDDENVQREVKEAYDWVFVDEYQDTNYLQEDLINSISRDNVYAVGDIKQAIYHFRYAEPAIFHDRLRRHLTLGVGTHVHLNENFRSRKEILDFVNLCCAEFMTEDFCSIDYRHSDLMRAGAKYRDEGQAVTIYYVEEEREKEVEQGLYSVRDAETGDEDDKVTETVVAAIVKSVGQKLYRAKAEVFEEATYKDMAVLCRRKRECAKVCAALEKVGVPYTVGDPSDGQFAPRELLVDFVRLCLTASDITVINVMLSPIFGFTPAELLKIRNRAPKVDFWTAVNGYNGEDDLKDRVDNFLKYTDELVKNASVLSATDVMTKALSDGLDGYFLSQGKEVSGRIYRFIESVKRLDCNSDIADFIEYYDVSYKGEKPAAKKDGVTVTTMHKSKGLEFPIVILPYIDVRTVGGGGKGTSLYTDRELGIALKKVDSEIGYSGDSFATKVHRLKKNAEEREEEARLAYVALTRAQNRLILVGKRRKEPLYDLFKAGSCGDFLSYAMRRNPWISGYVNEELPRLYSAEREEEVADREANFDYLATKYPYEKSTTLPNKTTVSEILKSEDGDRERRPFGARSRDDAAKEGTTYHLVMQKIDLKVGSVEKIREFIDELVEKNEIDAEVGERLDERKIAELLKNAVFDLARNNKCYRERPFISPVATAEGDFVLMQGVIDMLIEEEDGLTVVDYKASSASPEMLKERYSRQIELYADAAGKIWQRPVKRRILLNVLQNYEINL